MSEIVTIVHTQYNPTSSVYRAVIMTNQKH